MAGCCEHGDELSRSIKKDNLLTRRAAIRFLRRIVLYGIKHERKIRKYVGDMTGSAPKSQVHFVLSVNGYVFYLAENKIRA